MLVLNVNENSDRNDADDKNTDAKRHANTDNTSDSPIVSRPATFSTADKMTFQKFFYQTIQKKFTRYDTKK